MLFIVPESAEKTREELGKIVAEISALKPLEAEVTYHVNEIMLRCYYLAFSQNICPYTNNHPLHYITQIQCIDGSTIPIIITYTGVGSMVDGKCRGAMVNRSCQRCPQCNALPREMNNVELLLLKAILPGNIPRMFYHSLWQNVGCLIAVLLHMQYPHMLFCQLFSCLDGEGF